MVNPRAPERIRLVADLALDQSQQRMAGEQVVTLDQEMLQRAGRSRAVGSGDIS